MGWLFKPYLHGISGKAKLIADLTSNEVNRETGLRWDLVAKRLGAKNCLGSDYAHQPLWTVWDLFKHGEKVTRYIRCDLLSYGKEDGWGYKDMTESCGPNYYDCPLSFLNMTPGAKQDWRDEVVKHHAALAHQKNLRESIKPGSMLTFKDLSIKTGEFAFYHKRSMAIKTDKGLTRLAPKFFNRIVEVTQPISVH
jgi:hypothetical protein